MEFAGLRLLVVEDELLIALALEDMLNGMGCEVAGPANTVDEARRLAEAGTFDGALLDVNVAGRLVFPVAELLLKKGVPVILCSGYSATTAVPPPFSGLPQIAKPYDETILRRVMGDVFGGRETPRSPRPAWRHAPERPGELSG